MNRVVITGIGAVSPLGNTFSETWESVKAGRPGVSRLTKIDPSGIPWKVAGELKGFDANAFLNAKEQRRLDPFVQYAVAASYMALEDAGMLERADGKGETRKTLLRSGSPASDPLSSGGVIIGSSRGGITSLELAILSAITPGVKRHRSRISPYLMPSTTISMASSYVALKFGIKGYCLGISNACASGTNAIGEAFRILKAGYEGPLLAGGSEAPLCRLSIEGYGASGALSRGNDFSASRPFDSSRDGFVLAEGACVMVLENLESALERKAPIYGEIAGYANNTDAFHQTRPDAAGEARAIRQAVADAGMMPEDVDYISAHGTSTPLGDAAESAAIREVFGDRTEGIPVSALKAMTGHMLAASGALETASAAMSLREGVIPPTTNLRERDARCALNIITSCRTAKIKVAVSNSFGFGGVNAVVVLKKS